MAPEESQQSLTATQSLVPQLSETLREQRVPSDVQNHFAMFLQYPYPKLRFLKEEQSHLHHIRLGKYRTVITTFGFLRSLQIDQSQKLHLQTNHPDIELHSPDLTAHS